MVVLWQWYDGRVAAAAAPKPQTATYRQQQLLGCAHLRQSVVSRGAPTSKTMG